MIIGNQRLYLSSDSSHSSALAPAQATTPNVCEILRLKHSSIGMEAGILGEELKRDFINRLSSSRRGDICKTLNEIEKEARLNFGMFLFLMTSRHLITSDMDITVAQTLTEELNPISTFFMKRILRDYPNLIHKDDAREIKMCKIILNPEATKSLREIADAFIDMQNDFELRRKIARLSSLSFAFKISHDGREIIPIFSDTRHKNLIHLDLCTGTSGLAQTPDIAKHPERQFVFVDKSDFIEELYKNFLGLAEVRNCQMVKADILQLPQIFRAEGSLSTIRLANVGAYIKNMPKDWYDDMSKLLAPGGRVVISSAPALGNFLRFSVAEIEDFIQEQNIPILEGFMKSMGKRHSDLELGHISLDGRFIPNQGGFMEKGIVSDSLVIIKK